MNGTAWGWRAIRSVALAGAVCLGVVASAVAQPAHGRSAHLDSGIREALEVSETVAAIVRVDPGKTDEVRTRLAERGRPAARGFSSVSLLAVDLSPEDIEDLAVLDGVLGISLDAPLSAAGAEQKTAKTTKTSTTASTTSSTGTASFDRWLAEFGASMTQWLVVKGSLGLTSSSTTGAGVGVAVVDSGIDGASPAFAGRIKAFYDFTQGGVSATPTDGYGHGTHVAGLIGSADTNFTGVAPGVHFVGVKVLDASGAGRTSDLLAALDFLIANRKSLNIHIVNLSLGHPILESAATDPLVLAVERAVRAGLIVVTSAGNYGQHPQTGQPGYAGITSPGNAPSAITVGSVDLKGTSDRADDAVSAFSSRGPTWFDSLAKPDLVAPGHGLFATAASGSTINQTGTVSPTGSSVRLYGTSMAAATTSGVVALMLEANHTAFSGKKRLPPAAIKAMLQYTAVAVNNPGTGGEYDLLSQGAGGLNAHGALALARHLDPGVSVGAWWLTAGVTESSWLGGKTVPWTRRIIWGADLLYGQAVYANAPAWQNNIVWGDALVWGESLLQGGALIWGDTIVWAENVVMSTALIWGEALVWGEGLVSIDGQSIIWSDALIWGDTIIWGDTLIWGENVPAQSTPSPP